MIYRRNRPNKSIPFRYCSPYSYNHDNVYIFHKKNIYFNILSEIYKTSCMDWNSLLSYDFKRNLLTAHTHFFILYSIFVNFSFILFCILNFKVYIGCITSIQLHLCWQDRANIIQLLMLKFFILKMWWNAVFVRNHLVKVIYIYIHVRITMQNPTYEDMHVSFWRKTIRSTRVDL